jgi:peptidoglycan/LPS O-acetylase OafA/YrhL
VRRRFLPLNGCFFIVLPEWEPAKVGFPATLPLSLILSHVFVTGIGADSVSLDNPMWTLIIEVRASLIFPFMFLFLQRAGWLGFVVVVIADVA